MTVIECIESWQRNHAVGRAWRTQQLDRNRIRHLVGWFGEHHPQLEANQIRAKHLRGYLGAKLEAGQSGWSIAGQLSTLRRCVNVAIEDDDIRVEHHIPWHKVMIEARKATASAPKRRDAWDQGEVGILLEEAAKLGQTTIFPAIKFAFLTGCRRGELLGLTWEDIDFEGRRVNWRQVPTGEAGGAMKALKGLEAGERVRAPFPVNDELLVLLRTVSRVRVPRPRFVFCSPQARQWGERNFSKAWERVRAAAIRRRVRNFVFHSTRHTYVTWSLAAGIPPSTVAARVGDAEQTIWRHYAHAIHAPAQDEYNPLADLKALV